MTSTICGSGKYYIDEIFKIVRIDRLNQHTCTYVFVGNVDKNIKELLYNLETKGTLPVRDKKILEKYFGKNVGIVTKHKTKNFKYIYQKIYTDDSISVIRKKIFGFLSLEKDLLLEQNQELWIKLDDGSYKILGPYWNNINAGPSFLQKEIKADHKYFVSKNGTSIIFEEVININDQILYDATNNLRFQNNEIFLHMIDDEIAYANSKGIKIDQMLIDGYFVKFWPHALLEYNKNSDIIYDEMENTRKMMKTEDKLINFVNNVEIDESMFAGCRIIQVLLHITNEFEGEFVDLFKIFTLLSLDKKTPFKRFRPDDAVAPYYFFHQPLIEERIISEKQVKDWISATKKVKNASDQVIKEIQYSVRGLTIKRYIYTIDNEPKYATINIHRNGNIEIRIAFKEKYAATMKSVYDSLVDIGRLINDINKIPYVNPTLRMEIPKNFKLKLNAPDVTFERNILEFHGRTRLIMMDSIMGVNIADDFDYSSMNELSNKYFTPFVSPILSKKNYEKEEFLAKFKRVSYYSRMNLEYEFIHKTIQQHPNILPEQVIDLLHDNYYKGKSRDDAIKTYKDWERRFGYMGSQGKVRQTGIEIRIKHGKIHINGSKSVFQMTNASGYIARFMNIFFNFDKYKKKDSDIFTNELSELENIENSINNIIVNNAVPISNLDYYNFGNTLGNIYANEELNVNISSNENIEEEITENIPEGNFNRNSYLAKNDDLGKDIRKMTCDKVNKKHDVCEDFCEDKFYTLRRLQRYDNPIFKFEKNDKFEQYSRKCQQQQDRQPIVLKNDPAKNPAILPGSYKNVIKYGSSPDRQNYYICAQVFCPEEEIPLPFDLIKDRIQKRKIREGTCYTALCPYCEKKGKKTWLKVVDPKKFQPWVGFIDESYHPKHLCMPCCFKRPQDVPSSSMYGKFMKCLGKNVNTGNEVEEIDYVMGRDKMPLPKGRLGLLPPNVATLLGSRCDTGKMPNDAKCYLRYGVKNDANQSFLEAIVSVVEQKMQLDINSLKTELFMRKLDQKMFDSLNHGELSVVFDISKSNPIDNFRAYMMSNNQMITEEFLWDYLSRPKILEEDGLNIYILNSRSIICPVGFNAIEFYNPRRKSVIIYTDGRYYEPIYYFHNQKGNLNFKKIFNEDDPNISKLYQMATTHCISKQLVDWERIRKNSLGNKYFAIQSQITAKEILETYKEKIKGQVKDSYNKAFAFVSEEGYLMPFKPQGVLSDVEIISNWHPKNLKYTLKFYKDIVKNYNYPYEPMRAFKMATGQVNAIQLEDNSIIPVGRDLRDFGLLEASGKYYYNVDKFISEGKEMMNERALMTLYYIYIQESYERLRLEVARKLQVLPEKEKIIEILDSKDISKRDKKQQIYKILEKICRKIVVVLKNLPFPIERYVKPKLRRTCGSSKESSKCLSSMHCYFSGGECKLIVLDKSPFDKVKLFPYFVQKLTEEIVNIPLLRDEIIYDKLDEIISKVVEKREDEIMIDGSKDLLKQVAELFKKKKEYELRTNGLFSKVEPNYKGVNKDKYLSTSAELTLNTLNLQPLPSYWKKIFGPKVMYYDDKMKKDTLYSAMLRILGDTMNQLKTVKSVKSLEIQKVERITSQEISEEPIFKGVNGEIKNGVNRLIALYKHFNGNLYKNVNTIQQLREFILTDDYPANMVDIFVLSQALGMNIVVLEKRVRKSNPKGFYGYMYNRKKDFIMLLEQQMDGRSSYGAVSRVGNYIFKRRDLPDVIRDFFGVGDDRE